MWQRLLVVFLLAVSAFFVVRYFSAESFKSPWIETPAMAVPVTKPPVYGEHDIAASGPNPPAASAPPQMRTVLNPPPEPSDPYEETQENSNAPEQMRYPERSFGPGLVPEQTEIAANAGIAGAVTDSSQAFQQFSPEFVGNGGNFFGNVAAAEDENPNYSAF